MHDIDTSCPADLKPYADVYNLEKKQKDNDMWMWFGTYGLSAVSVAVEHCLAGKKAKSKYVDKPIAEHSLLNDSEMTEEEIQKQRELFVAKLKIMQSNYELSHPKKEEVPHEN